MTIIDQYIRKNRFVDVPVLAKQIGVSSTFVQARLDIMQLKGNQDYKSTSSNEMAALVHLIEVRKTGWAVEVAKLRIQHLSKMINF